MAATTTGGVSLHDFEKIIEGAVSGRGSRYAHRKAIHIHWKNDQTHPEKDLSTLEKLCSLLNFSAPESIVIDESDPTPGHTMRTKIGNDVQDAARRAGRTILIVHYAGHGTDNGTGGLVLSDRTGKKLARADLLFAPVERYELDDNAPLDVLFIFDCCFSFLATREMITGSRIVEVLAANDSRDPIAFGAKSAHSFTSKLYMEIRRRAHAGDKLIEIADIMDTLQQTAVAKRPSHTAKIGLGSIVLSLIPSSSTRPASSPAPRPYGPGLLATFTIHSAGPSDLSEVQQVGKWAEGFPLSKNVSLHYEGANIVNSALFFFEARRLAFMRISGIPAVTLICENRPQAYSLLPQQMHFTNSAIGYARGSGSRSGPGWTSSRVSSRVSELNDENQPPQNKTGH